jgi:alpha-beta hydrolase superfamily lysophospholipase
MDQRPDYQVFRFPSATQTGMIEGRVYLPLEMDETIECIQIIHGMAEHMDRYNSFCRFLVQEGFAVCIHDQAGHGRSTQSPEHLGFFGPVNGADTVLDDIDTAFQEAALRLTDPTDALRIRRFLLGHSMGSFIGRLYCAKSDANVAGAIFSGTSGANPMVGIGILLAGIVIRFKGASYRSKLLETMSSSGNLKRIPDARTPFDWLTRDRAIVDAYNADPACGYRFTAAGYRDLLTWLKRVSSKHWAQQVPVECPVLIVSGDQDPIGQYGEGPAAVAQWLEETGHQVTCRIYSGGRHESLNEINREDVWRDIADWLHRHSDR